jgi:ATP/ADP translocase
MFFKKIQNRKFDHIPRFYNPDDDKEEKRKKKLKFRVDAGLKRKTKSPILFIVFLLVIIYFIVKLSGGA